MLPAINVILSGVEGFLHWKGFN